MACTLVMRGDSGGVSLWGAVTAMALLTGRAGGPDDAPDASVDRGLVDRMAAGDERALGALYDRYASVLFGLALRVTGEAADAEEAVLDTLSQAWRDAARFDPARGSAVAWLTMICRSRSLDLVRSRGRRARVTEYALAADPDGRPAMGSGSSDPAETATLNESARQIAAAMATLPGPQRAAVELAFFEGLSHSEIAGRLDEPIGTVKTRIRAAMQKLRGALRSLEAEAR